MTSKLLFELSLFSDFDYPALIAGLVSQYASEAIGISAKEQKALSHSIEASYQYLLQHGVWHYEKPEIKCALFWCEHNIVVRFSDKAQPWQEGQLGIDLGAEVFIHLNGNRKEQTKVEVFNLGLEGRQMRLTFPLTSKNKLVPSGHSVNLTEAIQTKITYRLLVPSEAYEMVSCMYTAYGYTYGIPDVYSHGETATLMDTGQMVILAAEAEDGTIAGVSTLRKRGPDSKIFDLCQTAIKPEYKGNRIFGNLLRGVLNLAETTLSAQGVSATIPNRHLVSQDRLETAGFVPMGIFLGMVEADFLPKQIGPFAQERESFLSVYKPIHGPNFGTLHTPFHHQAVLTRLCQETGIEAHIRSIEPHMIRRGTSKIQAAEVENMKAGFIEIKTAGEDIIEQVYDHLTDYKQRHFSTVHLYLDLSDPNTMAHCERFESMGFFFAAFFPDEKPWLILQYLNNVPVLFDELLYPFSGAKYIQYHIERVYRLVQLREKGEFVEADRALALPSLPQFPDQLPEQTPTKDRLSG